MARYVPVNAAVGWFTGEDKIVDFTVYVGKTTTVQNITGWSVSWQVKAKRTDTSVIISKTVGAGIVLTTPVSGVLTVTVSADDIASLIGEKQYWHELKRTDSKSVLAQGPFTLSQAVHV